MRYYSRYRQVQVHSEYSLGCSNILNEVNNYSSTIKYCRLSKNLVNPATLITFLGPKSFANLLWNSGTDCSQVWESWVKILLMNKTKIPGRFRILALFEILNHEFYKSEIKLKFDSPGHLGSLSHWVQNDESFARL